MFVKLKGKTLVVKFKHAERATTMKKIRLGPVWELRKVTTCTIETTAKKPTVLARGEAFCRPPDQFSRAKGRKQALKRAVMAFVPRRTVHIDPETIETSVRQDKKMVALRKAFWDAFFAQWPRTKFKERLVVGDATLPTAEELIRMARGTTP